MIYGMGQKGIDRMRGFEAAVRYWSAPIRR